MDVLWYAPLVALVAALGALVFAAWTSRRCTTTLVAAAPPLAELARDVAALHVELAVVRTRLEQRRAAAGGPAGDR